MARLKRRAMSVRNHANHPVLLGDLRDRNVDVQCWCNRCPHHAVLTTRLLIARYGANCPVPEIGAQLRCSGCGSKDVATRPNWTSLGLVALHG